MNLPLPFSPWDMTVASINFGAMCGHGALAAAVGTDVSRVMQYFDRGGWVNVPTMGTALHRAGFVATRVVGWPPGPHTGPAVTILQWTGRWMNEGVPAAARCEHRHWVAVRPGVIWDCNAETWMPREVWEKDLVPTLLPPKGDGGWHPYRSFIWLPGSKQTERESYSAWQRRSLQRLYSGDLIPGRDLTSKQRDELMRLVHLSRADYDKHSDTFSQFVGPTMT